MKNKTNEIKLGLYKHYKGKLYEVVGVARHSESLEELVIYKGLYDSEEFGKNPLWARPKSMFFEEVIVDNKKVLRFEFVK